MRDKDQPQRPRENYLKAAPFMAQMNLNRRYVTRDQYARLRAQALNGDVEGASRELNNLIAIKYD